MLWADGKLVLLPVHSDPSLVSVVLHDAPGAAADSNPKPQPRPNPNPKPNPNPNPNPNTNQVEGSGTGLLSQLGSISGLGGDPFCAVVGTRDDSVS